MTYSFHPDDFWSGTFPEFLHYPDPPGDLSLSEMADLWPLRIRYLAMPCDPILLNEGTEREEPFTMRMALPWAERRAQIVLP